MMEKFDADDTDGISKMRAFFGPQQIDQQIRQAIQFCWMALPAERKTVGDVETEIRRIVERALRDLREDFESFGLATGR
jgi:BMFP domain-containing protein YqiC